jgi:hypothetical protein
LNAAAAPRQIDIFESASVRWVESLAGSKWMCTCAHGGAGVAEERARALFCSDDVVAMIHSFLSPVSRLVAARRARMRRELSFIHSLCVSPSVPRCWLALALWTDPYVFSTHVFRVQVARGGRCGSWMRLCGVLYGQVADEQPGSASDVAYARGSPPGRRFH